MDHYITGSTIKRLREKNQMTQAELAELLRVSDKAVSKWETCKGLPDISLIEPLARALHISVPELFSGEQIVNANRAANMLRSHLYVCPLCGNVIHATGNALVSCCGITLPPLEAEEADEEHSLSCERVEDEYFVSVAHEMSKQHYISFIAHVTSGRFELVKLYPEGNAEARFFARRGGLLYYYCNQHGLFRKKL